MVFNRKFLLAMLLAVGLPVGGIAIWQLATYSYSAKQAAPALQNGDIIFQTSLSAQSKAIQLATGSPYSHCGIVYINQGKQYVFEAVQPVKITPLNKWIARGENKHYVVKRLKDADKQLSPTAVNRMKKEGAAMMGKNYDLYFEWSDERIYCSELVWKIYERALGVEPGQTAQLKQFNLSNPLVQQKMRERYGNKLPLNETVISPAAIYSSSALVEVYRN